VVSGEFPTFAEIYERWFPDVARWVTALGAPRADVEDLTQDTFLIASRLLAAFDGQNLPAWLYCIARSVVRDHRRRAWFKHLRFGSEVDDRHLATSRTPALDLETKQRQQRLLRVLGRMSEAKREAMILFEIVGHSGEEMASILNVPLNTVWTRLHHARKEFNSLLSAEGERSSRL